MDKVVEIQNHGNHKEAEDEVKIVERGAIRFVLPPKTDTRANGVAEVQNARTKLDDASNSSPQTILRTVSKRRVANRGYDRRKSVDVRESKQFHRKVCFAIGSFKDAEYAWQWGQVHFFEPTDSIHIVHVSGRGDMRIRKWYVQHLNNGDFDQFYHNHLMLLNDPNVPRWKQVLDYIKVNDINILIIPSRNQALWKIKAQLVLHNISKGIQWVWNADPATLIVQQGRHPSQTKHSEVKMTQIVEWYATAWKLIEVAPCPLLVVQGTLTGADMRRFVAQKDKDKETFTEMAKENTRKQLRALLDMIPDNFKTNWSSTCFFRGYAQEAKSGKEQLAELNFLTGKDPLNPHRRRVCIVTDDTDVSWHVEEFAAEHIILPNDTLWILHTEEQDHLKSLTNVEAATIFETYRSKESTCGCVDWYARKAKGLVKHVKETVVSEKLRKAMQNNPTLSSEMASEIRALIQEQNVDLLILACFGNFISHRSCSRCTNSILSYIMSASHCPSLVIRDDVIAALANRSACQ